MQSLKKIGQKLLKLDSSTDGRRDRNSKFSEGITKYPATFCVAGYNKNIQLLLTKTIQSNKYMYIYEIYVSEQWMQIFRSNLFDNNML